MSPAFWRYTAFQVPGWILAALGGWALHHYAEIPGWAASGVLVAWVIKDYALYPVLGWAYAADGRTPIERLIGAQGTAARPLTPQGYVRVRGELWRARADEPFLDHGTSVRVTDTSGMTLVVERLTVTTPGATSPADEPIT